TGNSRNAEGDLGATRDQIQKRFIYHGRGSASIGNGNGCEKIRTTSARRQRIRRMASIGANWSYSNIDYAGRADLPDFAAGIRAGLLERADLAGFGGIPPDVGADYRLRRNL